MGATFHGLEVAKSGLVASQIAINVTSQNIANAKTEGYTRQSVVQNSVSAGLGPFQYSPADTAVGQGANITSIMQNRGRVSGHALSQRERHVQHLFLFPDGA